MDRWCISRSGNGLPHVRAVFVYALVLLAVLIVDCGPASALPAFARKYGMPCSACHEAWPMLSPFGQQFKDNGYQMGNDRDAPIFQQAADLLASLLPVTALKLIPTLCLTPLPHFPKFSQR